MRKIIIGLIVLSFSCKQKVAPVNDTFLSKIIDEAKGSYQEIMYNEDKLPVSYSGFNSNGDLTWQENYNYDESKRLIRYFRNEGSKEQLVVEFIYNSKGNIQTKTISGAAYRPYELEIEIDKVHLRPSNLSYRHSDYYTSEVFDFEYSIFGNLKYGMYPILSGYFDNKKSPFSTNLGKWRLINLIREFKTNGYFNAKYFPNENNYQRTCWDCRELPGENNVFYEYNSDGYATSQKQGSTTYYFEYIKL